MGAVAYPVHGLTMRLVSMIGLVLGGVALASCASTGAYIGDTLPEWAGGLPKGTPPRAGSPGYNAYLREISGEGEGTVPTAGQTAGQAPRAQAPVAPRVQQEKEPVDQPIH